MERSQPLFRLEAARKFVTSRRVALIAAGALALAACDGGGVSNYDGNSPASRGDTVTVDCSQGDHGQFKPIVLPYGLMGGKDYSIQIAGEQITVHTSTHTLQEQGIPTPFGKDGVGEVILQSGITIYDVKASPTGVIIQPGCTNTSPNTHP